MHKSLKRRIIGGVEILPFGHDLYIQLARKRLGITYRHTFATGQQARDYARRLRSDSYDIINQHKGEHLDEEIPIIEQRVLDIDYPILFWLHRLLRPSDQIMELGGSIGQGFYSFEHYFPYPENIHWTIAELPAAVEAGRRIAEQRQETRLSFIDSDSPGTAEPPNLFLSAGTLQYIDSSVPDLLSQLSGRPEHLLIHNLPAHPTQDYWTLQYLGLCEVPYHIYSKDGLTRSIRDAGYELVDEWKHKRLVEIPYHSDMNVEHYYGFYFKKVDSQATDQT